MKAKSIILSGLLLLGVGASTTSCEDMFTAENSLVSTNLAPQDTVYQLMGIVQNMQKIADRTVILGELRADLVDVNEHTPTALRQLATGEANSDDAISTANLYNKPADYYNVINSCNIYLAHVDSMLVAHGELYYQPEIIAAKTFRAWTYLELAKIYGEVPFYTEPMLTPQAAEKMAASKSDLRGIIDICDFLISDLEPYAALPDNKDLAPFNYNSWMFKSNQGRYFFIPVRLMLAELYLWRGSAKGQGVGTNDFLKAVGYYHDYLAFPGEEIQTGARRICWRGRRYDLNDQGYTNNFVYNSTQNGPSTAYQVIIPMDTTSYYGVYSDLRSVFCAQCKNNYYAAAVPSARLQEISQEQLNCIYVYNSASDIDTIYAPQTLAEMNMVTSIGGRGTSSRNTDVERYIGDLRFSKVYQNHAASNTKLTYHAEYSPMEQYIVKYMDGKTMLTDDQRQDYVPLYRTTLIYLHFAEALNRAGLPETAFAVLKYGISNTVLQDTTKVSTYEYDILQSIASVGLSEGNNAARWSETQFVTYDAQSGGYDETGKPVNITIARGSSINQWGIHAIGCGDVWYDKNYYLPADSTGRVWPLPEITITLTETSTAEDTLAYNAEVTARENAILANDAWIASLHTPAAIQQRQEHVDSLILAEEALEGMFEGTRYYDLMRYSMFYNLPNFIATQVSQRGGKNNADAALFNRFSGGKWYLKLPTR